MIFRIQRAKPISERCSHQPLQPLSSELTPSCRPSGTWVPKWDALVRVLCRHCCVRVQQVPNCSTNLGASSKIWAEPSLTCDCTSFTTTIHHFHTNTIKIVSIKHHILNLLLGSRHGHTVSVAIWMGNFTSKKMSEESWIWFSARLVRTVIYILAKFMAHPAVKRKCMCHQQASLIQGFTEITVNKLFSGYRKCYFWQN